MPAITLPDGSIRSFDGAVTGTTVAAAIGPGLARAALAMEVNGQLQDLSREITEDAAVKFITRKDEAALDFIRHDAAHVLAEAVQALYPGTQVTIGPAIENGFYYDFLATSRSPRMISRPSKRRCARSSPPTRPSRARCGRATRRSLSSRPRASATRPN